MGCVTNAPATSARVLSMSTGLRVTSPKPIRFMRASSNVAPVKLSTNSAVCTCHRRQPSICRCQSLALHETVSVYECIRLPNLEEHPSMLVQSCYDLPKYHVSYNYRGWGVQINSKLTDGCRIETSNSSRKSLSLHHSSCSASC